jgi:type II secretory ATPase GspE/PulE/Tfp pilus assembly ATPase PilB-like protein
MESEPPAEVLARLGVPPDSGPYYKGRGCNNCRGTGYRGLAGVFELITIDDEMRSAIVAKSSAAVLRHRAREQGVVSLRDAGMQKVAEGVTTLDEVLRAVYVEEGETVEPLALPPPDDNETAE